MNIQKIFDQMWTNRIVIRMKEKDIIGVYVHLPKLDDKFLSVSYFETTREIGTYDSLVTVPEEIDRPAKEFLFNTFKKAIEDGEYDLYKGKPVLLDKSKYNEVRAFTLEEVKDHTSGVEIPAEL